MENPHRNRLFVHLNEQTDYFIQMTCQGYVNAILEMTNCQKMFASHISLFSNSFLQSICLPSASFLGTQLSITLPDLSAAQNALDTSKDTIEAAYKENLAKIKKGRQDIVVKANEQINQALANRPKIWMVGYSSTS